MTSELKTTGQTQPIATAPTSIPLEPGIPNVDSPLAPTKPATAASTAQSSGATTTTTTGGQPDFRRKYISTLMAGPGAPPPSQPASQPLQTSTTPPSQQSPPPPPAAAVAAPSAQLATPVAKKGTGTGTGSGKKVTPGGKAGVPRLPPPPRGVTPDEDVMFQMDEADGSAAGAGAGAGAGASQKTPRHSEDATEGRREESTIGFVPPHLLVGTTGYSLPVHKQGFNI